ncbi:MAG: ABC transporter ATP-binding protein, partial [Bacilli bacterium]|nr:ABC transporter ATP-binding protein [Bacilli bacterium]
MPPTSPRASKGARNMNMVSGKARSAAIKRLLGYVLKYYPAQFVVVLVCVLLSSFTNVAAAYFTGQILVNEYLTPSLKAGSLEIVTPTSGALAGIPFGGAIAIMATILAIGTIALYVYNILMSVIGQGVQKRIRDELYDHMQDLPISYFDRRGRGDIMSVYTNDVDALREMLSRALPMMASSIVTMIACFVMMLITDLMLTGVVIVMAFVIFFIILYFTKMASRFFIAQQIELGKMNGYIEEMVNGQRVVKVFNYEQRNIADFKKHNEQFFNYSVKANRFANFLMPTVNQVGNLQYVLIALLGSIAVFNQWTGVSLLGTFTYGIAAVGAIVSFTMFSKAFVQPIGNVSQQLNIIALALAGATRIFEIIDAPAETDDGYVELVNAKEDENGNPVECAERTGKWAWKHPHTDGSPTTYTWLKGKITFNDVDFAYIPGKTVLHNISMYAEEGQKIAFVGPTGSGKTTITNLINRFYDIEDGKVRYDDININKIKKKDL